MAKVALLIGVGEYEAGFPALPGTLVDIEKMKRVLQNSEIGAFDRVQLLPNPSFEEMQIAIDNLFRSPDRRSNDLLVLYIAGHGIKDVDGKLYFVTRTTREREPRRIVNGSAVSATFIQDCMRNSCVTRQVLILDCCFSGAFADGMPTRSLGDEISAQLGGEGRAVLTASTAEQFALEREGSGVYTHYLVEGIETGAADIDSNGVITIAELHEYAKRKVNEAAPAMTPEIYAVREGYSIQLAKAPIGDPKLKYRKEVEAIVQRKNGVIDFLDRRILNVRRNEFRLSLEDVQAIEAEVLQPFEVLKQKLQEYQEALQEVIELEKTINDERWEQLKYLQRILQLRDEDVAPLENDLMAQPRSVLSMQSQAQGEPNITDTALILQEMQTFSFDVVTVDDQGREINRQNKQAEYSVEDLGNGVTLEMVAIPAGEFLMGSPESEEGRDKFESPQHLVKVPSFFMGKFEVTQAQWGVVAKLPKVKIDLNPDPSNFKEAKQPVERVSWFEAVEFCDRLSQKIGRLYRLPSEAEWEYACRAGTTTAFYFGATITTDLVNLSVA